MKVSRTGKNAQQPRRRVDTGSSEPTPEIGGQFRRNQTLSRKRSSHPDQVSGRSQLHSLSAHRRKVGGIFLLIAFIILVLGLLLTQFTARVSIARSTKPLSQQIDAPAYEKSINEYYAIHPVERLRFLLNQEALTRFVAVQHPEIAEVQLSGVTDLVEAGFTLNFREPIAGWQINTRQYYVDPEGVVFQKNYYSQPAVQIVDESGVSPEQGTTVASSRLLGFVGRVVAMAGERGSKVTSVTLPIGTTRQLDVRLDGVGGYVRFTIDRGVAEQVEDMSRVVSYLQQRSITAEYIDVRVEGKAIYR